MNKSILFLLMSDGISHQKMGMDQVIALRKLGVKVGCYYPKRNIYEIIDNPDYIFVLKSRISDKMALKYKANGSKIVFLGSDERYSKERMNIYDFILTISLNWQKEFQKDYPNIPCYLMKEEYAYNMTKIHKPNSFRIITMGYAQCLKLYLKPILDSIKSKYHDNIHILSNWNENKEADNIFKEFHQDNFDINLSKMLDKGFDKNRIQQYNRYDVGLVGSWSVHRPSNRLKSLIYAGLPVVALNTPNHTNVWFNGIEPMVIKVKNNDWVGALNSLSDYKERQKITDYNYKLVKENGGLDKAGIAILEAIKKFESRSK